MGWFALKNTYSFLPFRNNAILKPGVSPIILISKLWSCKYLLIIISGQRTIFLEPNQHGSLISQITFQPNPAACEIRYCETDGNQMGNKVTYFRGNSPLFLFSIFLFSLFLICGIIWTSYVKIEISNHKINFFNI